jgi:hypothetical protein
MSVRTPIETLARLRALLLAVLLFGLAGTVTDLLLIGHDEDAWQWIPLIVIGFAILTSAGLLVTRRAPRMAMTRLFQLSMVLLMLSGGVGSVLHYRANMEFKLEMDPSMSGFALFWSVVRATTPPSLAPGNLVLLGLLGLTSVVGRDVRTLPRNSQSV